MRESVPKLERQKADSFFTLVDKVSDCLKNYGQRTGQEPDFIKACDAVFDKLGLPRDFSFRLKLKSRIGSELRKRKADKKKITKKPAQPLKSLDIFQEANIKRIRKMQEKTPLFSEEIADKEGLEKLIKDK